MCRLTSGQSCLVPVAMPTDTLEALPKPTYWTYIQLRSLRSALNTDRGSGVMINCTLLNRGNDRENYLLIEPVMKIIAYENSNYVMKLSREGVRNKRKE